MVNVGAALCGRPDALIRHGFCGFEQINADKNIIISAWIHLYLRKSVSDSPMNILLVS